MNIRQVAVELPQHIEVHLQVRRENLLVKGEGKGAYTQVDHGLSRMTHRPSHLNNVGTEHVGFSPTRQKILLAPSAKRRHVSGASRMKDEVESY